MRGFLAAVLCTTLIAPAFAQDTVYVPTDDTQFDTTVIDSTTHPAVENLDANPETDPQMQVQAPVPAPVAPAPVTPASPAPPPSYEVKKFAVLQTLDKLTARTTTITVPVGKATAIGPIFIEVKTCQKTPPTEQPESAAFLQVWEAKTAPKYKSASKDTGEESQWVFSGWMFASSPALSAMNHPVYDVWVKDCTNSDTTAKSK